MPIVFRQIRTSKLTSEQQQIKLKKDAEYKLASDNSATVYYGKKHTIGTSAVEDAAFEVAHKQLWQDYLTWAKSAGLYEEVTVQQQLIEATDVLNMALDDVNRLRKELGFKDAGLVSV